MKQLLPDFKRQKVAELWPQVYEKKRVLLTFGIHKDLPMQVIKIAYKHENERIDYLIDCLKIWVRLCENRYKYRF